jgi:hypothetical protein
VDGKRSSDYWDSGKRWINGDYMEIGKQKLDMAKERMNIH